MRDNQQILEALFRDGKIRIKRGAIFDIDPDPMPSDFEFDRFAGMMLGLAVGDALGNTTEGIAPDLRNQHFGEIRDYLPNRYANGKRVGTPSDDTQLAFWTLEQLINDDGLVPERLATRFCRDPILGIGGTVQGFISNQKNGKCWVESGPESAGNGSLMRIAPINYPHLRYGGRGLWVDTALSAMITHNDTASISACIAFVYMFWQLLKMDHAPAPEWWLETYFTITKDLELGTIYRPRSRTVADFAGPLWAFVEREVLSAYRSGTTIVDACNRWYSGAYLLETVPAVLLILMNHGNDPEEAIVRAVNDTRDNDTIGAIVGAAVGALHGKSGIPKQWIANLAGRTTDADDGRIFELLDQASLCFQPIKHRVLTKENIKTY